MAQTGTIGKTHTTVIAEKNKIVVTYHNTVVVTVDRSLITLNTGGWRTATTKLRMNQASNQFRLGYKVYQLHGNWYSVQRQYRGAAKVSNLISAAYCGRCSVLKTEDPAPVTDMLFCSAGITWKSAAVLGRLD